jgi:hypothetical protein
VLLSYLNCLDFLSLKWCKVWYTSTRLTTVSFSWIYRLRATIDSPKPDSWSWPLGGDNFSISRHFHSQILTAPCSTPCDPIATLVVGLATHVVGLATHVVGLATHVVGLATHVVGLATHVASVLPCGISSATWENGGQYRSKMSPPRNFGNQNIVPHKNFTPVKLLPTKD